MVWCWLQGFTYVTQQAPPTIEQEPVMVAEEPPVEPATAPVLAVTPAPNPFAEGGPVAQRLADTSLSTRVRKALFAEPGLRAFDFAPEAHNGRITLRGSVHTAVQRDQALAVARGLDGVREVVDAVKVTEGMRLASAQR